MRDVGGVRRAGGLRKRTFASVSRCGRIAALVLTLIGASAGTARAADDVYEYDELGRLKAVTLANGTRIDYILDAAGNRKTLTSVVSDTTPPTVPQSLIATAQSATQINLDWSDSTDSGGSGLADYRVERCAGSSCSNFVELSPPHPTSSAYSDTTVLASTTYRYRVRARDGANNYSGYSNTAAGTTPGGVPAAPSLSASAAQVTYPNGFTVFWNTPSGTTSFQLYENPNNTGFSLVYSGTDTVVPRNPLPGEYRYYVRACNASGCSVNSNEVLVLVCDSSGCL